MKKIFLSFLIILAGFSYLNKGITFTLVEKKQQVTVVDVLQSDHSIPFGLIELRDLEEYKVPVRDNKNNSFLGYHHKKNQTYLRFGNKIQSFTFLFRSSTLFIEHCSLLI